MCLVGSVDPTDARNAKRQIALGVSVLRAPGTSGCAHVKKAEALADVSPQPRHLGKSAVVGGGFELGQRLDPQVLVDAIRRLRANTVSVANKCSGPEPAGASQPRVGTAQGGADAGQAR